MRYPPPAPRAGPQGGHLAQTSAGQGPRNADLGVWPKGSLALQSSRAVSEPARRRSVWGRARGQRAEQGLRSRPERISKSLHLCREMHSLRICSYVVRVQNHQPGSVFLSFLTPFGLHPVRHPVLGRA